MSARRGSATFVPKALPYRIDHSQENTGKLVSATKKVVMWKYGYPDVEHIQTVVLKHSITGGKKDILENGKDVVKIGSQHVATDFAHGWESQGHILRVAISAKGVYSFSVDGVAFEEFPTQLESKKMQDEIESKTKKDDGHHKTRRHSSTKKSDHRPVVSKRPSATFDPFASGGSTSTPTTTVSSSSFFDESQDSFGGGFDSSDPFASSSNVTKSTDPFSAGFDTGTSTANITTASSTSKVFETVKSEPTPTLARQFTSPPEPQPTNSAQFNADDLFADNSAPLSSSSSASTLPPPKKQPEQTHQPQANIDFFADSSPPPIPPAQTTQTVQHDDFFGGNTQQQQQQQSTSSSSAFDFTGMTYEMPTPAPMQHNQSIPEVLSPQQQQQQQQQQQRQQQHQPMQQQQQPVGNEGLFGLVNLDLSAGKAPPVQKKSIYDSSSNSNTNTHQSPAATSSVNPFDDFQHNTHNNYNNNIYNNSAGYNMGNNNWMASGQIGMMTDQSSFMTQKGNPAQTNNPQGKTSLDTLDWKM